MCEFQQRFQKESKKTILSFAVHGGFSIATFSLWRDRNSDSKRNAVTSAVLKRLLWHRRRRPTTWYGPLSTRPRMMQCDFRACAVVERC